MRLLCTLPAADAHAPTAGGASSWGRSSGGASSGSSGGGGFDFDFGSYGRSKGSGPAEEFYGLGDFFRDLDKELSGSEVRDASGSTAVAQ